MSRAPFTFIVNIMVPGNPPWSLCMSWAAHTRPDAVDGEPATPAPATGDAAALAGRALTLGQSLGHGMGEPAGGSGGFSSCSNTSRSNSGVLMVGGLPGGEAGGSMRREAGSSLLDSPFDLVLARCGPGRRAWPDGCLLAKNLVIRCAGGPGRVEGLPSLLDARSALMLAQPPWGPCHPGTSLLGGGGK